jgi:CRISPR-associated protein Csm2
MPVTNGNKKDWNKQDRGRGDGPKVLPPGYLEGGYFDESGHIRADLITSTASILAKNFGLGYTRLTNGQLRRFYGHAKTAEKAFHFSSDEKKLVLDIKALESFVAEAKGKDKVPEEFYMFIKKNTDIISDSKDVLKGFLPHFQAIVGFFTCHYPRMN